MTDTITAFIASHEATHATSCHAMRRLLDGTADAGDLAVLDRFVAHRAGEYPEVCAALNTRVDWQAGVWEQIDGGAR